jgi:hypothetical protein
VLSPLEQQLHQHLLRLQLVGNEPMEAALAHHRATPGDGTLDSALLELGLIDERSLTAQLAQVTGLPAPPPSFALPDAAHAGELRALLPMESALAAGFVPMRADGLSMLGVTSLKADPLALARLSGTAARSLTTFAVPEFRVYQAAAAVYGVPLPARYAALVGKLGLACAPRPGSATVLDGTPVVAPRVDASTPLDGGATLVAAPALEADATQPSTLEAATQRARTVDSLRAPLTLSGATEQLRRPVTRDEVFELLARAALGLQLDFAAVFTIHGAKATGRIALAWPAEEPRTLAHVELSLRQDSCLSRAVAARGPHLSTLSERDDAALLQALVRGTPAGAIAVPIFIGQRVVAILYGDRKTERVEVDTLGDFVLLCAEAGKAFVRLAAAAKSSAPRAPESGLAPTAATASGPTSSTPAPDEGAAAPPSGGAERDTPQGAAGGASDGVARTEPTASPVAATALGELLSNRTPADGVAAVVTPATPAAPMRGGDPLSSQFQFVPVHIDHFTGPSPEVLARRPSNQATPAALDAAFGAGEGFADLELASNRPAAHAPSGAAPLEGADRRIGGTPPADLLPSPESLDDGSTEFSAIAAWVQSAPEVGRGRPSGIFGSAGEGQGGRPETVASQRLTSEGPLPPPPEATMRALLRRFPGELKLDRIHHPGQLPPASHHSSLLRLLTRFGEATTPYLAPLLESSDATARYYATSLLCELGAAPEPVIKGLFARLFDSDGLIRLAAAEALRSRVLEPTVAPYVARLREELEGFDRFRIRCAAAALGELRDTDSILRLIDLVGGRDEDTALGARRALSVITKQNFGTHAKKWLSWWDKNRRQPRVSWLFDGLSQDSAELRRSAFEELRALTNEHFGYEVDLPKRDREEARKRWLRWWESIGRMRFGSSTRVPALGRVGPSPHVGR